MIEHSKFSERLRHLQVEVECLAKFPVRWESSSCIGAAMSSCIENGVPVVRYRDFSEASAAEELMHLRLRLLGMPGVSYGPINNFGGQAASMLLNVLDHHLIFPELSHWGFEPMSSECRGVATQLSCVASADFSRLQHESQLEALFAMLYARAQLDCNDAAVLDRVNVIFCAPELANARDIGEQVVSAVRQLHTSPEQGAYRSTLATCLSVLGLTNIVTIC